MPVTLLMEKYYTQQELKKELQIGYKALKQLEKEGLKGKPIGNKVYYKGSDFDKVFEETKI